MYILMKMGGKWYAVEYENLEDQLENIEEHTRSGTVVVIADDLCWAASEIGVHVDDIELVD